MMGRSASLRLALALLAWLTASAQAAELPKGKDGIFPVSSEYSDVNTGKKIRLTGAGSLIQDGDRWFILTAAHVSQGEDLQMRIGDKPVRVLGRLADNRNDIELIEIENPGERSIFTYFPPEKSYLAHLPESNPYFAAHSKTAPQPSPESAQRSSESEPFETVAMRKLPELDHSRVIAMSITYSTDGFILVPPWMKKPKTPLDAGSGARVSRPGSLQSSGVVETESGDELYADGGLVPGLSGSVLVADHFLTSKGSIIRTIKLRGVSKRYLNHFKGSYFASASAITRLREAYLSGTRGQMDRTRWLYAYDTTFRDFGEGTREIRSLAKDAGNGTSSDGGNRASSEAPRITLPYGMTWKNQPVIGFLLEDKNGQMRPLLAEVAALDLLDRAKGAGGSVKPVPVGSSLQELLKHRFRKASIPFWASTGRTFLSAHPEGTRVMIELLEGTIVFTLDPQGRHIETQASEFQPVISVRASNGGHFRIDLSSLFFENPSESRHSNQTPTLRMKRERDGEELAIRFEHFLSNSNEGVIERFRMAHPKSSPCLMVPLQSGIFPEVAKLLESLDPVVNHPPELKRPAF